MDEREAAEAMREMAALKIDALAMTLHGNAGDEMVEAAAAIRALPLPEATADPRDAALEMAREALSRAYKALEPFVCGIIFNSDYDNAEDVYSVIHKVLAAIEAAIKGGAK